jgi:hypothetical protein
MELLINHATGLRHGSAGGGSQSLYDAFGRQIRVFDDPLFDNAAAYAVGLGVLVGCWVVQWLLSDAVWYAWTANWKRICGCCCGRTKKGDAADPLWRNPNDPNESANKPQVLPVVVAAAKARFSVTSGGNPPPPRKAAVVGDVVGVTPQPYKEVPVVQTDASSTLWSGAKRSRSENYARLAVLVVRLLVMVAGVILAFQAAGVNVLSLAASMGIISLCLSYGGANLLRNFLNAMYIHGMDKLAIGVYVKCGNGYKGIVTAFRAQWSDVTDDLSPWQGRQIHQIPNAIFMENIITVYPDGPPPEDIRRYYLELEEVNKFRASRGLAPKEPIDTRIWDTIG